MTRGKPPTDEQKLKDARFLADEFDMPEPDAAELVSDDAREADEISAETNRRRRERDPLAGVPVPDAPTEDHPQDNDEQRLKPVLRTPNDREGGG